MLTPLAEPVSSSLVLANGPRDSEMARAVVIGTGGSVRRPSMAS